MRLTSKVSHAVSHWALALGLIAALGACGRGGDSAAMLSSTGSASERLAATGPASDYPMVLGDPYSVDGQLYTPVDTTSYDEVGYAAPDPLGGTGVTAAHKTLPLPSYVEVTSLVTGKTILARVERRGPMTGDRVVALSPDAQTQLGTADGTPVRVRRVNPPEVERAKLRQGGAVAERLETPQSLVAVLKRKLPERGSANLGTPAAPSVATAATVPPAPAQSFEKAFEQPAAPAETAKPANYALSPIDGTASAVAAAPAVMQPKPAATPKPGNAGGKLVVQAATFSSKTSAQKVASSLGGFIMPAGRYYRVRVGPFTNRGQADAALAKVRAAGYSDARVSTTG